MLHMHFLCSIVSSIVLDLPFEQTRRKAQPHLPQYCAMDPVLAASVQYHHHPFRYGSPHHIRKRFTPATHPVLAQTGPPPWRTSAVTINHTPFNSDIDMQPTGHSAIHHHPSLNKHSYPLPSKRNGNEYTLLGLGREQVHSCKRCMVGALASPLDFFLPHVRLRLFPRPI
jgi:hypothetical protein